MISLVKAKIYKYKPQIKRITQINIHSLELFLV